MAHAGRRGGLIWGQSGAGQRRISTWLALAPWAEILHPQAYLPFFMGMGMGMGLGHGTWAMGLGLVPYLCHRSYALYLTVVLWVMASGLMPCTLRLVPYLWLWPLAVTVFLEHGFSLCLLYHIENTALSTKACAFRNTSPLLHQLLRPHIRGCRVWDLSLHNYLGSARASSLLTRASGTTATDELKRMVIALDACCCGIRRVWSAYGCPRSTHLSYCRHQPNVHSSGCRQNFCSLLRLRLLRQSQETAVPSGHESSAATCGYFRISTIVSSRSRITKTCPCPLGGCDDCLVLFSHAPGTMMKSLHALFRLRLLCSYIYLSTQPCAMAARA
jgi:hypothetical protein